MLHGLVIRVFHFRMGLGMISAVVSRGGIGAWARTIFNDRAYDSWNVSLFSQQE